MIANGLDSVDVAGHGIFNLGASRMTITLKLSTEQERRLEEGAARHDAEIVRQVLLQAVDATVPKLLERPARQLSSTEFRALLDSIAADCATAPSLTDEAVSRAGIYGDHP